MLKSRTVLIIWLALYGAFGVIAGFAGGRLSESPGFNGLVGLFTGALIYTWCKAEVLERGALLPSYSALYAALFPPVGLPVHFYRTRNPPRRVFVAMLKALGFFILANIVLVGCEAAVHVART
jgi:hypothetical protein